MNCLTSSFPISLQLRRSILVTCLIFSLIGISLPTAVYAEGYSGTYYVVKKGDTLRNIASAHGTSTYAIAHANGLHDINRIEVGQHLYIPHHTGYQPQPVKPPAHKPQSNDCYQNHTVRKGESLSGIAHRYGIDPYRLAKANHIYDLNHIYVGQQLCLPSRHGQKSAYKQPAPAKPNHYNPPNHYKPAPYTVPKPYVAPTPHSKYAPGNAPFNYDPWTQGTGGYLHHPHYQTQVPHHSYHHPTPTPVPPTPTPAPQVHKPANHHYGWTGSYYANTQCAGTPLYTRHDAEIDFEWGYGGPGGGLWNDMFSIEWTTKAYFSAGDYKFYALADDGVRVYVDNQLVIDGWKEQGPTEYISHVWLGEGHHHVKVQYFEQTHSSTIKFHWRRW